MELFIELFKSVILGIVEGVTEFLPVSSTGHLIIFQNLIGFGGTTPRFVEMYTYVIQLGAILAVVVLYWKKIWNTLVNFIPRKGAFQKSGLNFWLMVVVACIPGGFFGILLDDLAEKYLFKPVIVALVLFFGGIAMVWAERVFRHKHPGSKSHGIDDDLNITVKQAIIIGCFQCLAIIPGMSRSASTIIGGWVAGLNSVAAAEFSFFLAIPVMVGMSTLKLVKIGGIMAITSSEMMVLAVGFLVSFVVAILVIRKFISYLQKKSMRIFAQYRMIFAVVILAAAFMGKF